MTQQPHVLVVDDDSNMCEFLRSFLAARGYAATTVATAAEALVRFQAERPSAVLLDVALPGDMDGLAALAAFKQRDRDVPVIVVSGHGHTSVVVQAMKLGANDFLCKPFAEDDLALLLARALRQRQLAEQVAVLRAELQGDTPGGLLAGSGDGMSQVRALVERVADTDVTVLIRGERGTGKEIVARALHEQSRRHNRPFVKVNCAALPPDLLESELFGCERGAFAGATQHKPGKFEFANRGTIFLDEIGELGPALQARLLQVIHHGEFCRLGGTGGVQVDARLVAATSCDLETAVAMGLFRDDLYLRLNVVTITLPPLRDRRDDITTLTEFFLKKYAVQYNRPLPSASDNLRDVFLHHDWPGNVRQLESLVKRFVVLGEEAPIVRELRTAPAQTRRHVVTARSGVSAGSVAAPTPTPTPSDGGRERVEALPGSRPQGAPGVTATVDGLSLKEVARSAAREAERELIQQMLTRTRWNRKEAAEQLGISYKALLYKIKDNGLDKAS